VSPIFVRPVREQLEHDRLIRHLLGKFKRKYEVAANVGDEQVAFVKVGANTFYPDLTLSEDGKLSAVIEVETGESVNRLEAMAQWVPFAKVRVPFSLYVPVHAYDAARRLCEAHGVTPSEIWTYRGAMDTFDLVRIFHDAEAGQGRAARQSSKGSGRTAKAKKPAAASTSSRSKSSRSQSSRSAQAATKRRPAKTARKSKAASKSAKAPAARKKASASRSAKSSKTARTAKAGARKK
jgi:hypothetical protein